MPSRFKRTYRSSNPSNNTTAQPPLSDDYIYAPIEEGDEEEYDEEEYYPIRKLRPPIPLRRKRKGFLGQCLDCCCAGECLSIRCGICAFIWFCILLFALFIGFILYLKYWYNPSPSIPSPSYAGKDAFVKPDTSLKRYYDIISGSGSGADTEPGTCAAPSF